MSEIDVLNRVLQAAKGAARAAAPPPTSGKRLELLPEQGVCAVAFSPDGSAALVGLQGGGARVYDTATGALRQSLYGRGGPCRGVAFLPNQAYLHTSAPWINMTFANGGTVEYKVRYPNIMADGELSWLVASADGRKVFIGGQSENKALLFRLGGDPDVKIDGRIIHESPLAALAMSMDSNRLLSAGRDGKLTLWDITSTEPQLVRSIVDPGPSGSAAFLPDAKHALTGGVDGVARLWDLGNGTQLRPFAGLGAPIRALAVAPSGRFAVVGAGRAVHILDLSDGSQREVGGHADDVAAVALSTDERFVLSAGDQRAVLWDLDRGSTAAQVNPPTAVATREPVRVGVGEIRAWRATRAERAKPVQSFSRPGYVRQILSALALDADGVKALVSVDEEIQEWDLTQGSGMDALVLALGGKGSSQPYLLFEHGSSVREVAYKPGAARGVLSAGIGPTLRLLLDAGGGWRIDGGDPLHTAVFDRTGQHILVGSRFGSVKYYDDSGKCLFSTTHGQRDGENDVAAVAIAHNGRVGLSAGTDGTLRLWDLTQGTNTQTIVVPDRLIASACFGLDDRICLTGGKDGVLRLWDLRGETCVRTLRGHEDMVTGVALTPDARMALSTSWDRTLRIWDLAAGTCVECIYPATGTREETMLVAKGHTPSREELTVMLGKRKLMGLSLSANGNRVLTGSWDCDLRVFEIDWKLAADAPNIVDTLGLADTLRASRPAPAATPAAPTTAPSVAGDLEVTPGIGAAGIVIGRSTVEDVLRTWGNDCKVSKSSREAVTRIYYDADGDASRRANESRPREVMFDFLGTKLVSALDFATSQKKVVTRSGVRIGSKRAEVLAAFGRSFIFNRTPHFDVYRFQDEGIEFDIDPDDDRVVTFCVFASGARASVPNRLIAGKSRSDIFVALGRLVLALFVLAGVGGAIWLAGDSGKSWMTSAGLLGWRTVLVPACAVVGTVAGFGIKWLLEKLDRALAYF